MKLTCTRCNKRLSRKTARQIDGEPVCSPCLFGQRDSRPSPVRDETRRGSGERSELGRGDARSAAIAHTLDSPDISEGVNP